MDPSHTLSIIIAPQSGLQMLLKKAVIPGFTLMASTVAARYYLL